MRVWVIFLLFFAISFVVAYREESKKTAAEKTEEDRSLDDLDSKEFEKAGEEQAEKKKKETNSAKQKPSKQQEVDEDEAVAIGRTEEVGEKLCQALNDSTICAQIDAARPKMKTKDRKPDKDDDKPEEVEYVCENKEEGMCLCSNEQLDCVGHIDDPNKLDTADIVVNEESKNLKIQTADFSQNRIKRLKKNHVLSKREDEVEKLVFEHNFINKIEAGVFEPFKSLHILKLGHNRITKLDKNHLSGLSGLHQLWLNNNQIKKLEDGTFKELKNLTKLILDGNKIPIKKELFEGLDNLKELSLDDCDIKVDTLDANVFDHLKQLKVLSMRKNPLQEVPKALKALDNLERLDLSETFIVELHEKCFDKDSKLKVIRMANSSLFAIQERALSGLRLEEIDMPNNKQLSEIHPDAFGMDGGENPTLLKKINFANGNLSTITEDTFYLSSLEEVAFGGNPWNCDCNTEFLLGEEFEKYKFKEPYPKCHFPKMLQSKNFFEVRADQACPASRKTRAVFRGVKVLAILLLLTVLCIASFMVYNKGYIQNFLKTARNGAPAFPSMTYSNLNNTTDDGRTLETDFQPRPEDV